MFEAIAAAVTKRGWLVVLAWVGLAVLLGLTAPNWNDISQDDNVRLFPAGSLSVAGQDLLDEGFPGVASSDIVLIAERPDRPLDDADRVFVTGLADRLRELVTAKGPAAPPGRPDWKILQVTDYREPFLGDRLVSKPTADRPGQAILTTLAIDTSYMSKQARLTVNRVEEVLAEVAPSRPADLNLAMTGSTVVGHDTNEASNSSIDATTAATIGLVVVILLLVYRSPLLALIPLVAIALSVFVSLKLLALMTTVPGLGFGVIAITKVFVIVVLFGAGTDYCLFLIARYREELARGRSNAEALRVAIEQVGGALLASAGTVIVGLGMLWFSTFSKIKNTGPSIALSLAVALLAALTLAPVLLRWLRGAVFWPFKPPHHTEGADPEAESLAELPMAGVWGRIGDHVVRRPGLILALSILALMPFAWIGTRARPNYGQLTDLSPNAPSIVGSRLITKYFRIGELGRTTVLLKAPGLDFTTEPGRRAIADLSKRLVGVPHVAEVRSATQPLGTPLPALPAVDGGGLGRFLPGAARRAIEATRRQLEEGRAKADTFYNSTRADGPAKNHITRIDLIFDIDPYSVESLDVLDAIRAQVAEAIAADPTLADATAGYAGSTTQIHDLKSVITVDERRMYVLVTVGVYLILVLLLRRPGISLYLIATVIFGYLATLGMTELAFRAFHAGPEPWVGLDWKVGFFLFVILVAVGEDYNIFLMSRVVEEEAQHGPIEGTRRAVAHTGGIISSCGLIMAGTFASMLTGKLLALRELGFALGLGVLLDTFIVRPILVPAFVVLLHRGRRPTGRRALATAQAKPAPPRIRPRPAPVDGDERTPAGGVTVRLSQLPRTIIGRAVPRAPRFR